MVEGETSSYQQIGRTYYNSSQDTEPTYHSSEYNFLCLYTKPILDGYVYNAITCVLDHVNVNGMNLKKYCFSTSQALDEGGVNFKNHLPGLKLQPHESIIDSIGFLM